MPSITLNNVSNNDTITPTFTISGIYSNAGTGIGDEEFAAEVTGSEGVVVSLVFSKVANPAQTTTFNTTTGTGGAFSVTLTTGSLQANTTYNITPKTSTFTATSITGVTFN